MRYCAGSPRALGGTGKGTEHPMSPAPGQLVGAVLDVLDDLVVETPEIRRVVGAVPGDLMPS